MQEQSKDLPLAVPVPSIVPTKPQNALAKELHEKLVEVYKPVLAVMDEAEAAGFRPVVEVDTSSGKARFVRLELWKIFYG